MRACVCVCAHVYDRMCDRMCDRVDVATQSSACKTRTTGWLLTIPCLSERPCRRRSGPFACLLHRLLYPLSHSGCCGAVACSDQKGLVTSTLVYGEIAFDSFAIAFQKVRRRRSALCGGARVLWPPCGSCGGGVGVAGAAQVWWPSEARWYLL